MLIHDQAPALVLAKQALELVVRDPTSAVEAAAAAVEVSRGEHDRAAEAVAWRARSLAEQELGRVRDALAAGRSAVRLAGREGGDLEAETRMSLAFVLLGHGSVAAALHQADRAAAAGRGLPGARVATQRALILQRAGRHEEALAGYARALPVLRKAGDSAWEARLRNNRGLMHAYHGSLRDAEVDLGRALDLYEAAGAEVMAAGTEVNLGFVAARRGDAPAALRRYDRAAERYAALGRPAFELLLDRAELLMGVGAFGEARRTAERAATSLAAASLGLHLAEARLLLAQAALADGDPTAARTAAREAARLFGSQGRESWAVLARYVAVRADERAGGHSARLLADALAVADDLALHRWRVYELDMRLTAATVALARRNVDTGREQLRRASAARTAGPLAVRLRAWYAEALLRLHSGDAAGAERGLRAGMALLERERETVGATELRMHVSGHGRDITSLGLRLAVASGSAQRVLAWGERARSGALRLRPVTPPREEGFAATLSELRRASAEAEEHRLGDGISRAAEHRVAVLEAQVRAHARRVGGSWSAAAPSTPTRPQLASALRDRCLVELVTVDDRLVAVTCVGGRTRMHELGRPGEVADEARALTLAVRRLAVASDDGLLERALRSATVSADALDRLLLAPLRATLDDRSVVLVPTVDLQSVPWSMLPSLVGRELSLAPSAAIFYRAASADGPRSGGVVTVAGPRLATAEAEARAVGQVHGAEVLVGASATAAAVLDSMARADCVHIAAHGRLRSDNPLLSSLQLADGPLTVYDLEQLPSAPRLMLLPVCQSGVGAVTAGSEVMGLTHALISLGSAAVVATVVPVPDEATLPLMVAMHRGLAGGAGPAAALAQAQAAAFGNPRSLGAAAGFLCFGAG